jgi:putative flippase GtrA
MKVFVSRQFASFLVTGGIAAAVNYCSRYALEPLLGFSAAIVVAYGIGMLTAYLLARRFVFLNTRNPTALSATYFALINLLAVSQTWLVSMGLALYLLPHLGVTEHVTDIAHFFGVITPVFTSYLGHKYLSFRQ